MFVKFLAVIVFFMVLPQALHVVLLGLLASGSTWGDVRTQCVLGGMLLRYRSGIGIDPRICVEDVEPGQDQNPDDDYDDDRYYGNSHDYGNQDYRFEENGYPDGDYYLEERDDFDKRAEDAGAQEDQFVQVHKYWADRKRNNLHYSLDEEEQVGNQDWLYNLRYDSKSFFIYLHVYIYL